MYNNIKIQRRSTFSEYPFNIKRFPKQIQAITLLARQRNQGKSSTFLLKGHGIKQLFTSNENRAKIAVESPKLLESLKQKNLHPRSILKMFSASSQTFISNGLIFYEQLDIL